MIGDDNLDAAVAAGLLSPELRAKLVAFAASRRETETAGAMTAPQAKFDPVHVLYYAGALLVMGAMGLFANVKHATRLPGGLCVAVAVSMAPLAIYGIQDALGLWIHLFGAMTLWGAVTSGGGGEFSEALFCAFNIVFIALGLFFDRRVYAVFGAIGLTIYLGRLAFDVFKGVLVFSFTLSAIGLAIIFAGVFVERRRHAFGMLIDAYLPEVLRALCPPRARHA
jgi:hypothetical protein